jgi:hypothetical protein
MAELDPSFKIDYKNAISNPKAIFKGKFYRITILSDILIRLEYDTGGIFEDRPTELALFRNFPVPKFEVQENDRFLVITTKHFRIQYIKDKPFIGSMFAPDTNLRIALLDTDKIWYFNHEEARNFGGYDNHLDNSIIINNTKDAKNSNNFKLKGLYSTDGFVSLDDSKSLLIDENGYLVKDERPRIDTYLFMYKRDFGPCLQNYFTLSGYPPLIPRYALGIWWNKTKPYNMQDLQDLVFDFNKYRIPISTITLGEFWHIKDPNNLQRFKSGFTFNPDLFPKDNEVSNYLHERGIRLGVNIDPKEGIHPHEKHYAELADALNQKEKMIIPFNALDKNFIKNYLNIIINPLHELGVDYFWVDYNPINRETLNALNYYEFNDFKKLTKERGLLLSRISTVAPHRYPVHYSGETLVSWDTLKELPYFNSLGSNLGLSWWSHDIGGFKKGIEDAELYLRYVELGTFSPIFRFASETGHFYKRKPWEWDVKTYSIVKSYCELRQRLVPYLYGEAYKYHKNGMPLVEPLYYSNPAIYDEIEYKNEYLFGTELLVAPITKEKDPVMQRSVEHIYLPAGTWYDFKTGKKFIGDKRYYIFYKDEDYPVFAKSGSIICLADLADNINVTNVPKTMEVQVFPGKSNVYNLYEDDGVTNLYQEGYYIVTRFDYNYLQNNYTLIIRPFEGKSGIIPERRNYRIRFRNTREARNIDVLSENSSLPYEAYIADNDYVIEVKDVDTTKQLTIICRGRDIEIDTKRIINEDIDSIITDLSIPTSLKAKIAGVMYSDIDISRKRIYLKKLKKDGLDTIFIKMFLKLLDYIKDI